jgi:hypothetical protein
LAIALPVDHHPDDRDAEPERAISHGPPGQPTQATVGCACWLVVEAAAPVTTLIAVQVRVP